MKNKIHSVYIRTALGTTSFWVQKQDDGKFHFQMDSCEAELSRKNLKELISEIEQVLSE
ncbi:hypothetical protein [Bacteroides acidifaciens]|uniref:hypothetical protein n=1 Tax=Bacteroides acidifaciens TaxID=85831 RepID=UPI00248C0F25|nr:hypothetical protein [Bacteroides acidifaciens]